MKRLLEEINGLMKSKVCVRVEKRLSEFASFSHKGRGAWFSELCFCILTANSKAKTAISIQKEMGATGFLECGESGVRGCIRRNKHRFHNNKARFIVAARVHEDIKSRVRQLVEEKGQADAREWIVKNVKGIGYKEASHFLRNIGYFDVAILDRHIVNLMVEHRLIKEKPKILGRAEYRRLEKKFRTIADKVGMSLGELDLYMWYIKTGEVLK